MPTPLFQCGLCGAQWAAPEDAESRHCGLCRHDEPMARVGTVEETVDGWERAGRVLAHGELELGYRVSFEDEFRAREPESIFSIYDPEDRDVEPPLVTGQIYEIEETPAGPRYEIGLDVIYWMDDEESATKHIWHWEVEDVLERTKASVRLDDIRREIA